MTEAENFIPEKSAIVLTERKIGKSRIDKGQSKALRVKHSFHALRKVGCGQDFFTIRCKVDAGTYLNTCKFMHQFAQSKFLHTSCSCCDLRPMLWNRYPHPLRAAARRLCFSLNK